MLLSSELTLEASPRSASDARRWVSEVCRRLDRHDLVECAELGVSELVANAILHANAPYTVRVRGTVSHPRIEVLDGSTSPPVPPTPRNSDDLEFLLTFGRGLSMVAQCALSWGASIEQQGKVVWFEPAPTMHEDDSAELVIDWHDAAVPEPISESAVEVQLLGVDVPLYASLDRQYNELRRELRLLSLSHQSDYPLAGDLTAMFADFERQFPETYTEQIRAAQAEGRPRIDMVFPLVPEAGPIFETMTEMFDVADAFCSAERLLSLARTSQQRELHLWLLGELISQLEGASPQAWQATRAVDGHGSTSQVG